MKELDARLRRIQGLVESKWNKDAIKKIKELRKEVKEDAKRQD